MFQVDVKALERAATLIPGGAAMMAEELRLGFASVGEQFLTFHSRERLKGRPGLIMRSGNAGMSGSAHSVATGDSLASLQMRAFWSGGASRYVETHEYGKTIVPVRAKYLRFHIPGVGWRTASSVTIPARLEWIASWERFASYRTEILHKAVARAADKIAEALS